MFAEKTLELLKRFVAERHAGVTLRASRELGIPNDTLNRWITDQRDPSLSKIGPVMDMILWQHSEPKIIGTLEVTFPALAKENLISDEDITKLRKELEQAKKTIAEQEKQIFALEKVCDKLEGIISNKTVNAIVDEEGEKSCA